jgi:hypothetical protein
VKVTLDSGSGEVDITAYILNEPTVSRRVEAESGGEPGLMVLDDVQIEMPMHRTGGVFDEDSIAGSALPSYYLRVYIHSDTVPVFTGLVDWDTVSYTQQRTVQFTAIDLLKGLTELGLDAARDFQIQDVPTHCTYIISRTSSTELLLGQYDDTIAQYEDIPAALFEAGDFWRYDGNDYFVTYCHRLNTLGFLDGSGNPVYGLRILLHNPLPGSGYIYISSSVSRYKKEFYGIAITRNDLSLAVSFDAVKIIIAIVNNVYPGMTVVNNLSPSYFDINLDFQEVMGNYSTLYRPFDQDPYNALKYLVTMMRIYLYIDRQGRLVFDKAPATGASSSFTLETDHLLDYTKKFSWQNRIDYVNVICQDYDGSETEAEEPGNYRPFMVEKMERTVFKPESESAADIAEELWELYGKRHLHITAQIRWTAAMESGLDLLTVLENEDDSRDYYIIGIKIAASSEIADIEAISLEGWED